MGNIFEKMELAIIDGDEELCASLAQKTIDEGIDPIEAIEKGYAKGMRELGDRFESGECFLPALLFAEDPNNSAMEILKPKIEESKAHQEKRGKVVIGTIQGDVHDIGKNIVKLFMSVAGFDVIDLGRDVPVRNFIQTAQKENADIIAASALMTTTMVYMPELIKQLKELGLREHYKVMVGGACVIKSWAQEVGSDGYGLTAKEAVENAKELLI
jgi:trimethylamine corrinoid protein